MDWRLAAFFFLSYFRFLFRCACRFFCPYDCNNALAYAIYQDALAKCNVCFLPRYQHMNKKGRHPIPLAIYNSWKNFRLKELNELRKTFFLLSFSFVTIRALSIAIATIQSAIFSMLWLLHFSHVNDFSLAPFSFSSLKFFECAAGKKIESCKKKWKCVSAA